MDENNEAILKKMETNKIETQNSISEMLGVAKHLSNMIAKLEQKNL